MPLAQEELRNITTDNLIKSVKLTRVFVLVLTPKALTRPWVLLEIYTALDSAIPIVPVGVDGLRLGSKTSNYLSGLATNVFDARYMRDKWSVDAWGVRSTTWKRRFSLDGVLTSMPLLCARMAMTR